MNSSTLNGTARPGRFLALLLLPGLAAAQNVAVWPAGYAAKPGGSAQEAPFSVAPAQWGRNRAATTFAAATLPFPPGASVLKLANRRDALFSSQAYAGNQGAYLRILVGAIASAAAPSHSFHRIWSGTPTLAFDGALNLPPGPPPGAGPASFNLQAPFFSPWSYPGGDIAVDITFSCTSTGPWRRDALPPVKRIEPAYTITGEGCPGWQSLIPVAYIDVENFLPGGRLDLGLYSAPLPPAGTSTVLLLGIASPNLAWIPLPIDLSLAGLARGCLLHTDIVLMESLVLGDKSTLYSRALASWPIPDLKELRGALLSAQWLVLDASRTTPLPMTVSNEVEMTLGVPVQWNQPFYGRTIWLYGAEGLGVEGGRVSPANYVAVYEFTWK